jgi:hypothetical protein
MIASRYMLVRRFRLAAACVAFLAGCAASPAPSLPEGPEPLRVPAGEVLSLRAHGTGVQIYTCQPSKDDPAQFAWALKAPEADLVDGAGMKIARHYAGPTWEAKDGSKVIGEVVARDNGPDPAAISWLLLSAKSTSGTGVLSNTQFIQRLRTSGGKAPAEGCDQAHRGAESRVAYSADYLFYSAKP